MNTRGKYLEAIKAAYPKENTGPQHVVTPLVKMRVSDLLSNP